MTFHHFISLTFLFFMSLSEDRQNKLSSISIYLLINNLTKIHALLTCINKTTLLSITWKACQQIDGINELAWKEHVKSMNKMVFFLPFGSLLWHDNVHNSDFLFLRLYIYNIYWLDNVDLFFVLLNSIRLFIIIADNDKTMNNSMG